MDEAQAEKVGRFMLRANGTMNPKIVGKSAKEIADMAGITIPAGTRVLLSVQTDVSKMNPYSREKLCPILAFYVEDGWQKACERCIAILQNEGVGHTMTIHSQDTDVIREFALKKPVSRLLVNTPGALGGTGVTTNLPPALTLGCGAVGGSATSDNITPLHLINIRRIACGVQELDDIRKKYQVPASTQTDRSANITKSVQPVTSSIITSVDVEAITKAVIEQLKSTVI